MLLAVSIFLLTLILVIWQPRGLSIGWSACIGAVLALVSGVIHVGDIPVVWNIVWNATATFIAVIIISLLLDESGFFEWAALHVSRWGNGRGRLLFTWIILLGAAVAALFANDGAALILTPIVIAMLLALGFSKRTTLAFVMAAGFIADTASLPLIVSNLVNIVSADFFRLGFTEYASVMLPVDIAAIAATLGMLHLFFRRDIPATYDVSLLKMPASAIKDPATFKAGWIVLVLLLVGFFVLEPLGIPVSAIAAVGAAVLFAVAKKGHSINTGKVLRGAPWLEDTDIPADWDQANRFRMRTTKAIYDHDMQPRTRLVAELERRLEQAERAESEKPSPEQVKALALRMAEQRAQAENPTQDTKRPAPSGDEPLDLSEPEDWGEASPFESRQAPRTKADLLNEIRQRTDRLTGQQEAEQRQIDPWSAQPPQRRGHGR